MPTGCTRETVRVERKSSASMRGIAGSRLVFSVRGAIPARERTMGRMLRGFLMLVAIVLTAVAGVLPACGTMNGGGTKYLIDPLPDASIVALA